MAFIQRWSFYSKVVLFLPRQLGFNLGLWILSLGFVSISFPQSHRFHEFWPLKFKLNPFLLIYSKCYGSGSESGIFYGYFGIQITKPFLKPQFTCWFLNYSFLLLLKTVLGSQNDHRCFQQYCRHTVDCTLSVQLTLNIVHCTVHCICTIYSPMLFTLKLN